MAKEIELHPGHWKNTGSGANGILNEVTEARKVTKRVYEILQASGVPSTYFEDNNSTSQRQNINKLVSHHNADRDGLIVSVHFNASAGTSNEGIGTEVYYYNQKDLAAKVSKAISDATGGDLKNRGAKQRSNLGVLSSTYEPAILIEVCFVNSVFDAKVYNRDFEKICQAIAKELAASIGKTISTGSSKKEPSKAAPSKQGERYFYTGGYSGDAIVTIHTFLKENGYFFVPSREDNGSLFFNVGAFTEGTDKFNKMKKFLDDHSYWYEIR